MPLKNGRLTAMEKAFAERMAVTGDPVYSATKAGYRIPEVQAYQLTAKPDIQADIARRTMAKLAGLGDLAVKTINDAMTSSTSTWTNKLMAAEMVVKRLERGDAAGDKEPSEMTASEIESTIRALRIRQIELGDQAKDITPDIEPESSSPGVFE